MHLCENRRPTDTALSLMPYLRRISARIIARVTTQMEIAAAKGSSLSPYCKSISTARP